MSHIEIERKRFIQQIVLTSLVGLDGMVFIGDYAIDIAFSANKQWKAIERTIEMSAFLLVQALILVTIWKRAVKMLIIASLTYLVIGLFIVIYFTINHMSISKEIRPPNYFTHHIDKILLGCDISLGIIRVAGCALIYCIYCSLKVEIKRKVDRRSANSKGLQPLMNNEEEEKNEQEKKANNEVNDDDEDFYKNKPAYDYLNSFDEKRKDGEDNAPKETQAEKIPKESNKGRENDEDNDYKNHNVGSEESAHGPFSQK